MLTTAYNYSLETNYGILLSTHTLYLLQRAEPMIRACFAPIHN